jgi:hypothetical protein
MIRPRALDLLAVGLVAAVSLVGVLLWNLGLRFDVSLAVAPVLLLAAGLVALHYWRGPIAMR